MPFFDKFRMFLVAYADEKNMWQASGVFFYDLCLKLQRRRD